MINEFKTRVSQLLGLGASLFAVLLSVLLLQVSIIAALTVYHLLHP
jgi:hypothetical protein